jgi:O-antigen/teichoic acid export membrane protein
MINVERYVDAFTLAALWLLIDLLALNIRGFLFATDRIGTANIVDLLRQCLWIPLIALIWLGTGHLDIVVVVACSLIGSAAGVIYGALAAGLSVRYGVDLSVVLPALRFSIPLLIPVAAVPLMRLADRSVISASRSLGEVAAYSVLTALASGLYSCSALSIETALLPKAIHAANVGDLRGSRSILWTSATLGGWAFVIGAGAIWLGTFILLSTHNFYREYADAFGLFPLVLLGYLLMILTRAPHNALLIANSTRVIFAIDFLTLGAALTLDFVLIPPMGIAGAAIANILSFGAGGLAKLMIGDTWREVTWWRLLVPRVSALSVEERDVR